ncbi:MAG: hypothetical protein EA415_15220 [Sphaerobacteraceae bacterium]|nr:MAG: hypothetical protein EA415_15220 [Sphaerobacteraceae bacterium]
MSICVSNRRCPLSRSIIFFGIPCSFADTVLAAILEAGHDVRARVVPGNSRVPQPTTRLNPPGRSKSASSLPISGSAATAGNGHPGQSDIPVLRINNHQDPGTQESLAEFDADIAIVCCYSVRIPQTLMTSTRHGGLNVHPSLLPRFRGPEPLFWTYREGTTESGVTIHQLIDQLDAGPIVRQHHLEIPIGKSGGELWLESAAIGGQLVTEILQDLETSLTHARAQLGEGSSYQSWPTMQDLQIDPAEWEAWHVFHFCRGVIPLGYQPEILTDGAYRRVVEAVDFERRNDEKRSAIDLDVESVECRDGQVLIKLA